MEITVTLKEGELIDMIADMRETGKDFTGHTFKMDRDESAVGFTLSEQTIDEFLEELRKVKLSKSDQRSVLIDQVVPVGDVDCDLSFLLVPEYKDNVFKESLFKEA